MCFGGLWKNLDEAKRGGFVRNFQQGVWMNDYQIGVWHPTSQRWSMDFATLERFGFKIAQYNDKMAVLDVSFKAKPKKQ